MNPTMQPTPEQGPDWLVAMLMDPSEPVVLGMGIAALCILALAGIGYHRHGGVDDEVLLETGRNVLIVIATMMLAEIVVRSGPFPYVLDVLVCGVGGWLVGLGGQRLARKQLAERA